MLIPTKCLPLQLYRFRAFSSNVTQATESAFIAFFGNQCDMILMNCSNLLQFDHRKASTI